jgi:P27 family predicted phage terminase small subunit
LNAKVTALKPPKHLRKNTAAWFSSVLSEYDLDSHHILLLQKACEAYDRSEMAREAILKNGMTFNDRFDRPCARPEIAIERDSRLAFARLIREIGLDISPSSESRPNSLPANRE